MIRRMSCIAITTSTSPQRWPLRESSPSQCRIRQPAQTDRQDVGNVTGDAGLFLRRIICRTQRRLAYNLEQGKWCVGLVFQDHDNLVLPSNDQSDYWPLTAIPNTVLDELFINGREGSEDPDFQLICLQRIYRVNDAVRESGRKQLRAAIKHAYARTRMAMESDVRWEPGSTNSSSGDFEIGMPSPAFIWLETALR